MANDTVSYFLRANAVRYLLAMFPNGCPSWREADVQTAKLERMALEFNKKFGFALPNGLGRAPETRAQRKKRGVETRKLDQQAKNVHGLMGAMIEEIYFLQDPKRKERKGERKKLRLAMDEANRSFEKVLYESSQEMRKHVLAALAERKSLSK